MPSFSRSLSARSPTSPSDPAALLRHSRGFKIFQPWPALLPGERCVQRTCDSTAVARSRAWTATPFPGSRRSSRSPPGTVSSVQSLSPSSADSPSSSRATGTPRTSYAQPPCDGLVRGLTLLANADRSLHRHPYLYRPHPPVEAVQAHSGTFCSTAPLYRRPPAFPSHPSTFDRVSARALIK